MTSSTRRMRSRSVTLGLTTVVAAGLTGCAPAPDNQAICVDPATQLRVDDDFCDEDDEDYDPVVSAAGGYYWYYVRSGTYVPAVSKSYVTTKGTYDSRTLTGSTAKGGVSSDGGSTTVTRGGFGGSSKIGS